jgi:SWI/SNF-related matrix-associated actin-dependent regulator of chromatin subfamily A3
MAKDSKKRMAEPIVIDLTGSSPIASERQQVRKIRKENSSSEWRNHAHQPVSYLTSSQLHSSQPFLPYPSNAGSSSHGVSSTQPVDMDDFDEDWVEDGIDINPSQSFQNMNDYCLYGNFQTKIVGCRYYNGYVTTGELVLVRREPNNQYDRNAIQVLNVRGEQIGHIPRTIAAKIATFMDKKTLIVEAHTTGPKDYFDCPIALQFYGSKDPVIRADIKAQMKAQKLPVDGLTQLDRLEKIREKELQKQRKEWEKQLKKAKTVVGNGTGVEWDNQDSQWAGSSAASLGLGLDDLMRESERFNPRSFDEMAEKFGRTEDILQNMPMGKQPTTIESKLLPFQLQGLKWMLEKESPQLPVEGSKDSVQLWKRMENKRDIFTHMATKFSVQGSPPLASGGILADDMGLGKTIQVISLIMADRELRIPVQFGMSSATLIISPLSVMSNWTQQIQRHVQDSSALRILVYHGTNRLPISMKTIGQYDVVITTYDTVRSEYFGKNAKNREVGIGTVNWRRVVLDEGHIIRNPAAKTSTAIYALKAQSRWALSGTPIVNSLKDLFSLVRFLGLSGGMDKWELFNGGIIRPLNAGNENAGQLLQALMNSICLRRKKDMKFIDLKLPELSEYIHRIEFHPHEKEQYDALSAEAEGTLETYNRLKNGTGSEASKAYRNLLEILLRLRQLCNHWQLVGKARLRELEGKEGTCLDLTPENRELLENMLQLNIEAQEDCPVCMDNMNDPIITLCSHTFCFTCIEKVIDTQHKCPMCRAPLEDTTKLLRPKEGADSQPTMQFTETSSKVEALLSILKASSTDSTNKTVVFSQWTSFLDVVGIQLVKQGFHYVRIDGKMTASQRDASMTALESDPNVTILLASLNVCSVGLNLVAANQVILADSWWAPAIEDQAVDRVHRLGQTRQTTVFRLVMSESIEDKVLEIQKNKRKLMMLAFAEKQVKRGNERGARLADIQTLLSRRATKNEADE